MESLPYEILLPIFRKLSFRDCIRLASTCSRLYEFLPTALSAFNLQTLHFRDKKDIPSEEFLVRNKLTTTIKRIILNVHLCQEDMIENLRSIFNILPHRVLQLERVAIDKTISQTTSQIPYDLFSHILAREFYLDDPQDETAIILPGEVENCSVRLSSLKLY